MSVDPAFFCFDGVHFLPASPATEKVVASERTISKCHHSRRNTISTGLYSSKGFRCDVGGCLQRRWHRQRKTEQAVLNASGLTKEKTHAQSPPFMRPGVRLLHERGSDLIFESGQLLHQRHEAVKGKGKTAPRLKLGIDLTVDSTDLPTGANVHWLHWFAHKPGCCPVRDRRPG